MKQRHNECVLATLCAITGTDYPTASDLFEETHGHSWGECASLGCLESHRGAYIGYAFANFAPAARGLCYALGTGGDATLAGTGILTIRDDWIGHALAYCDGIIWDPEDDCYYESLTSVLARYPSYRVDSITPTPEMTR